MEKLSSKIIYDKFCEWSPTHAARVEAYQPWGSTSIVVWFRNGMMYKVKYITDNKFVMQIVTKEDIDKKFSLGKGEEQE